jgi:hypothetical protein
MSFNRFASQAMNAVAKGIVTLLCIAFACIAAPAHAQDSLNNKCIDETYRMLFKEQLFYRSTIFGQKAASELPHGAVRYDNTINPWIKTGDNQWKTYGDGYGNTVWSDAQMEQLAYPPKRRGILEVKKALSSEQLPLVLQSMRALQCRLRSVCAAALASRSPAAGPIIKTAVEGCIAIDLKRIDSCQDGYSDPSSGQAAGQGLQAGLCDSAAEGILKREDAMLSTVMSYDASYRSFVQFAGIMQGFNDSLRGPLLKILADTVRVMRQMADIPCFTSQCNE